MRAIFHQDPDPDPLLVFGSDPDSKKNYGSETLVDIKYFNLLFQCSKCAYNGNVSGFMK